MESPFFYLIDDDADDREIFGIALTKISPRSGLETAKNAKEALLKFQSKGKFRPDYIFLDLNMPGIHGIQCLAELKAKNLIDDVPVIIYSTSSNPAYIKETEDLGATHYLIKPNAISKLTAALATIIKGKAQSFVITY